MVHYFILRGHHYVAIMMQNTSIEMSDMEKELFQLRQRVDELGIELRHISTLLEGSRHSLSDRSELFELLRDEAREKAESRLTAGMTKRCEMRPECRQRFMELLDENLDMMGQRRISEEDMRRQSDKLEALRSTAIPGRCDTCLKEVGALFKDQTELMRQLRLYTNREEVRESIEALPEETVVRGLLEPMANVQRLVIMKALSRSQRSFSELSNLTNLRGGNLLFHLQRLTSSGMVFQRGGRGDYALTPKGHLALELINDLYLRTMAGGEGSNIHTPLVDQGVVGKVE